MRDAEAKALRGLLSAGGAVAVLAGSHTVAAGMRSIPGPVGEVDPIVESELRFYAVFYIAYGALMLRVAPRAEREGPTVRALAATLFVAGVGRLGAWMGTGEPSARQKGLLAIELGAPPLIAAWQSRVTR